MRETAAPITWAGDLKLVPREARAPEPDRGQRDRRQGLRGQLGGPSEGLSIELIGLDEVEGSRDVVCGAEP